MLETCKREHVLIFGEINISLKSSPWPGRRILNWVIFSLVRVWGKCSADIVELQEWFSLKMTVYK